MGQSCLSNNTVIMDSNQSNIRIENTDIVKAKLKHARDRINIFISKKQIDSQAIDEKLRQKIPKYKQTGIKKQLIPLLKAKKSITDFIESANMRLRLINDKLMEVELQKMNADTINVLDSANMYIKQIENQLQNKDWRSVLSQAEHKYHLQWPEDNQNVEDDPAFQQMWRQLGGNKISSQRKVRPAIPNAQTKNSISQNYNRQMYA